MKPPESTKNSGNAFEDRLRVAAQLQSPEFSQNLHETVMQRIHSAMAPQSASPVRRTSFNSLGAIAAGVALLLGVSTWIHQHNLPAGPTRQMAIVHAVPSVPNIQNPVRVFETPVLNGLATARVSYVDRDGEKLLSYMARQLDVIPQSQKR